ncbi:MAG: hypothetical protein SVV88_11015 [Pseudomonadota bacterium]|nr:hypothetical protein [Pseudomonadota bacterium]
MSNYHVKEMGHKKEWADVVFHISVPNVNNDASVNYRTAVAAQYEALKVPWLDGTAEHTQIINGEFYEHEVKVEFDADLTIAQKRDIVDAKYTSLVTTIQNIIQERFRLWGLDRDVP